MRGSRVGCVVTCFFLAYSLFYPYSFFAQEEKKSHRFYDRLKNIAEKRKLTRWFYHLVFYESAHSDSLFKNQTKNFKENSCKIIRKIEIQVIGPYTGKLSSNSQKQTIQQFINKLHLKTRSWVIKNQLLFQVNQELEETALRESERLLRLQEYIQDAVIEVVSDNKSDSVDVKVFVADRWALIAPVSIQDINHASISFIHKNILGAGQRLEQKIGYVARAPFQYNVNYYVNNIDHTYISGSVFHESDFPNSRVGIALDRSFYSPLVNWAGGVEQQRQRLAIKNELSDKDSIFKNVFNDWWIGKNIPIENGKHYLEFMRNWFSGFRFTNTKWSHTELREDVTQLLFSTGLSIKRFFKTRFLYRFGAQEDIPEGIQCQVSGGRILWERKPNVNYLGIDVSSALQFSFGYLSTRFMQGRYQENEIQIKNQKKLNFNFFSNLLRIKEWKFRFFSGARIEQLDGNSIEKNIRFTSEELYGLNGENSEALKKVVLNIEMLAYAPFDWLGFKPAWVIFSAAGKTGDYYEEMKNTPLYTAFGAGFLFRNEQLLNSTFQLTMAYYPVQPNGERNVVRFNPLTTFSLRINPFFISKPSFLFY